MLIDREMGQEHADGVAIQISRVPLFMKDDVAFNPASISFFCSPAEVAKPGHIANLIE